MEAHHDAQNAHHRSRDDDLQFEDLFDHSHDVDLLPGGIFHNAVRTTRMSVNSVHQQGIDRLGTGLRVAVATEDGLIEAISARPCGGDILTVQWHVATSRQARSS